MEGVFYYGLLVIYVYLQYADSPVDDWIWQGDVENPAAENQWSVWLSDKAIHEKYGYLEVRS